MHKLWNYANQNDVDLLLSLVWAYLSGPSGVSFRRISGPDMGLISDQQSPKSPHPDNWRQLSGNILN